MFPSRHHGIFRLFFALQLTGILALVWILYPIVNFLRFEGELGSGPYLEATLLLFASAILEYLTRPPQTRRLGGLGRPQLTAITHRQTLFSLVVIFGAMVMLKDDSLSRAFIVSFFAAYYFWVLWTNHFGYRMLHRLLYSDSEKGLSTTLLVGKPQEIDRYCSSPSSPRPPGTDFLGYVPVGGDAAVLEIGLPVLGDFAELRSICERSKARALLMLGLGDRRDLRSPISALSSELGLRTMWIEDVSTDYGTGVEPCSVDQFSVVSQMREPLEDPINRCLKRAFDLAFSSLAIACILPGAIAFVAILHRLYSPGPLFYRQERSGRNGVPFQIYKFRSMHADPNAQFKQATEGDPRIFKGGDLIRKLSIDELPQLLNVFRGEMSIVGPRPHPIALDEQLCRENPTYRLRNLSKPGLTGLAQSRGWRGETSNPSQIRNRVRLDLFYIQKWSPILDLRIIGETVIQVIKPPRSAR